MRAAALTLLLIASACGGTPEAEPGPGLPHQGDLEAIPAVYEPFLRPMGLRLTRASLVALDGDDPPGTHLALYVEPVEASTTRGYVERIVPLAEVFATTVFDRWPGLESFDVCQEIPTPGADPPPFASQVTIHREAAGDIPWEDAGLAELLARSREAEEEGSPPSVIVAAADEVERHPLYREALEHG